MATTVRALVLAALTASLGLGCGSIRKEMDEAASAPSPQTKTAAREAQAAHVAEINFEKNSFVLTEGSREALATMINEAKKTGEIDDIKILAWADNAYPSGSNQTLSKADRELAEKRAEAIQSFLKSELAMSDVDTLNMAERPGVFAEIFETDDARVKRAMESAGVTSSDGKAIIGKTSRAVVMVEMEDDQN